MIRFHGRQLFATAYNGGLGFLVGLTLTPLVFAVVVALLLFIVRRSEVGAVPMIIVFGLMAYFLSWRGVHSAAHDAARRYPISLIAVPIGITLGAGLVGVVILIYAMNVGGAHSMLTGGAVLLGGGMQAYAAMRGSRRGVLVRHGEPQIGVGEMCAGCMYDLRATETGKPCPECGDAMRFAKYLQI